MRFRPVFLIPLLLIALAVPLGASALLARATPAAQAQSDSGNSPNNGISVVGEGRVIASPDLARVVFGVERFDSSLNQTLTEASGAMDGVVNRLVQLGLSRDDIKTIRFSVSPVYDNRNDSSALRGYRVSNAVSVTIRDVSRVGSLIDEAVAAGATRVEGVTFETSRLADFKDQAREQAMSNARAKAEQLARLAGVSLARVSTIEESDASGAPPVPRVSVQAAPAALPATPIETGQLEIRTTVRVTWQIG